MQEVLAYSADWTDRTGGGWRFNGATGWNGGGLRTSDHCGFGVVDAHAAVRLAESWTGQPTDADLKTRDLGSWDKRSWVGPESTGSNGLGFVRRPGTRDIRVEHVELTLDKGHTRYCNDIDGRFEQLGYGGLTSELGLWLTLPSGTTAQLVSRAPATQSLNADGWTFASNGFWGESAAGNCTLSLRNHQSSLIVDDEELSHCFACDWSLTLFGGAANDDDRYVYTDAFNGFAEGTEPGRQRRQPPNRLTRTKTTRGRSCAGSR